MCNSFGNNFQLNMLNFHGMRYFCKNRDKGVQIEVPGLQGLKAAQDAWSHVRVDYRERL